MGALQSLLTAVFSSLIGEALNSRSRVPKKTLKQLQKENHQWLKAQQKGPRYPKLDEKGLPRGWDRFPLGKSEDVTPFLDVWSEHRRRRGVKKVRGAK